MVRGCRAGLAALLAVAAVTALADPAKPNVIVMTDGEIDDRSSMIRFLLYTCDVDLKAIIETNSMFQRRGHSGDDWYERQLDAYERIYPNLAAHRSGCPTADEIRAVSFVGDEDEAHLAGIGRRPQRPGEVVELIPEDWPDTPGSERIVEVLLEDDPAPVHIQAWGGGNTAARAFAKLKRDHPDDYERAVAKAVMFNIWYQDDAGNYIETHHPGVTMIYCGAFAGTWNYHSQRDTFDFIRDHVKTGHGPLGALYPQDYVSEGDSPAFFYVLPNGLRNAEHPGFGGWGGRYERVAGLANVYRDARDNGDPRASLRRWIDDANADFQARMDWTASADFDAANHPPDVHVDTDLDLTLYAGQRIVIDASKSTDPDGDALDFDWSHYVEAGTYRGRVELVPSGPGKATFTAPQVSTRETVHILLAVRDDGDPPLSGYARLVVTVVPPAVFGE
ncbi:MAG: DUF1593 domain-containing protein [Gammaproteobacteria bacterium]|nr:DUF1593 domain-containing protein [Gammaproteobacteria bacterium]